MMQERRRPIRRFFAALTILSFTLTQAIPAWALRPGIEGKSQSGLEEVLTGGASGGRGGTIEISPRLLRLLRSRQPRPIPERVVTLEGYARQLAAGTDLVQTVGNPNVPLERRIAVLEDLLGLALEDSVLEEPEVDPELAAALLTRTDPAILRRARTAFSTLKRICPTCGDHLYHEQGRGQKHLDFDQHDRLHVRTAIATAVEFLLSRTGRLPTVKRVQDGHHTEEPARSLGVMASMVSAFARNDEGPEAPPVSAVRFGNDAVFLERLSVVTGRTGAVILRVRHPRTQGDEADTWVSVRYVDSENRTVDLNANGEAVTLSWGEFRRVYLPGGDVYGLLLASQASLWSETQNGRIVAATQEELSSIFGCCGIIITLGKRSGEGQFGSMQDLAYRGQDNAGITVHDLNGLYTIKVEGSPTQLIRELEVEGQGYSEEGMAWYLEAFPRAELDPRVVGSLEKLRRGQNLNRQERRSIHRLWLSLTEDQRAAIAEVRRGNARNILDAHGYGYVKPVSPGNEGTPPTVALPMRKEDLYSQRFYAETDEAVISPKPGRPRKLPGEIDQWNSVGVGNQGEVWSGRSFQVPPAESSSYEAQVQALQAFMKEVNRFYDYEFSYLRDRLRFHLSERLEEAVSRGILRPEEAAKLMREFLRLFETVTLGRDIAASDVELWREIWAIMANTTVWFSGHIAWDPVRHVFRLQRGLVGVLRQRPEWLGDVEKEFAALLRRDRVFEPRDWFRDWLVENLSNTPSKASEALISWFQKEFIPDHVRRKMGIELGRVDAITLQYLEIVDEVFGHDRWATTGSKEAKDAQPHEDTGFLAGLSRDELEKLVQQAAQGTQGTVKLQVSPTAKPHERDRISKLLSEQFRVVAARYLDAHPEKVGGPQRSTPHNGDLSSSIQQGIRPKVAESGYVPVRRTVDESWQVRTETILTDTWGLLGGHEWIYDSFLKDTLLGLTDGQRYRDEKRNFVGFMPDAYRRKWNEIADKLVDAQKYGLRAVPITVGYNLAEEIAHRLVKLEFARGILFKGGAAGSEIGSGLMTTLEPRLKAFVSHNRPIYLMAVRNKDGQLVWQVSSDYRTALRLFDRGEVAKGVEDSNQLFLWKELALKELDGEELSETERTQKSHAELTLWGHTLGELKEAEIFRNAEAQQKAINDRFKLEFMFTFKGEEKYLQVARDFNPDTRQWDLILVVSDFEGRTLARYRNGQVTQMPPERERKNLKVEAGKPVEVDIASRFGFPSYGEKEIHQIPLALRETRFWYGLEPDGSLDMSREGVSARYGGAQDYGLNRQRLLDWFQGGGDTVILTGVGSSENDALADVELLKFLMPGVRVIVKDPSTLLNTAADFDPRTTMVVALSWSGTTALTLSILESLRERGLLCCAVTGNPDKEIGVAAQDSGGVVKAHTRQEVAVYTTVGFSTILYDLMLMAAYLNLLKEELETDGGRKADLKRRRSEVAPSLHAVPEIIRELRDRPERSLARPESYIHEVGKRLAPYGGMGFVGEDSSLPEIALKVGEVRNSGHTIYPYSSDQAWHLIRAGMPENRRKGWFLDASTLSKLRRALAWIQEAVQRGQPLVVQTFDEEIAFSPQEIEEGRRKSWADFNRALQQLAEAGGKDGRPHLDIFRVPRVHPLVQPIVNVQIGAPLATTTAKLAGLGSEARDTPRNIAKSVTVQAQGKQARAMRIRDFVQTYRASGMEEQAVIMEQYITDLSGHWDSMDSTLRAIHRLPLRMQEILTGFSAPQGFSWEDAEIKRRFGERLERLRRVAILSSEDENADIAAGMAQELLEYRESVTTNSEKEKIFEKVRDEGGQYERKRVQRLINGDMYEIQFVRSPEDLPKKNRIIFTRMKEEDGEWVSDRRELELLGDERGIVDVEPGYRHLRREEGEAILYELSGQRYVITADVGRGVNLTAAEPELAGVAVEVVAVEEAEDLEKATIDPKDTLVVALSRTAQRKKEFEREIGPVASLGRGRDAQQRQALKTAPGVKSEEHFSGILGGLSRRYPELAFFVAASRGSLIHRHANVGSAQLPEDLDVIDATPAFYLALLRFGIELGIAKGVLQAATYQGGLDLIPILAARTLPLAYQERVVVGAELFSRATRGIQVALNHRPIEVRYEPGAERVTFLDQDRQVGAFELVVDADLDIVRGFRSPANVLVLDGREYDIHFDPDHGVFIESRLPDYQGGGSLLDGLVSLVQRESGKPYTNWIFIGGGADLASAKLYRKQSAVFGGVLGHALVVDGSVHGPLAEVDDRVGKWLDRARRRGIDPRYDPDNPVDLTQKDAATVVLATDRRAYSASTIDLQRFVTRSGIVFPVVQVPDLSRSEIVESRAFLTLGVPEAPNLLTVIPHMILAPVFAYQLAQSMQREQYRYQAGSTWAEVAQLPRVIATTAEAPPPAATAPAPRPAVMPPGLTRLVANVTGIAEETYRRDPLHRIYFDHAYDEETKRTVLVIVGPEGAAGVFGILYNPFENAGISVEHLGEMTDHGAASYVVVEMSQEALGERGVIEAIENGRDEANGRQAIRAAVAPEALTDEEVESLYALYARRRVSGGLSIAEEIALGEPTARISRMGVVVPADDPRFSGDDQRFREAIEQRDPNGLVRGVELLGDPVDFSTEVLPEAPRVRFHFYRLRATEGTRGMRDAVERVEAVLREMRGPAAGMEELVAGRDYRVDSDGIRMIRSVRVAKPVRLSDGQGGTIQVGAGTLLLGGLLLRGDITIGESSEIGGAVTGYARIGNHVKVHGNSKIGFAEVGDWVHVDEDTTIRGYGRGAEELVVVRGGGQPDVAKMKPQDLDLHLDKAGVAYNTVIRRTTLETGRKKAAWSFVEEDKAPNPDAKTVAKYGVNQRRTEVLPGAVIHAGAFVNTSIGAGVRAGISDAQVKGSVSAAHSFIGDGSQIRPNANIVRSYLGKKNNVGSEVSKSYLGDGFVSEHQASYISVVAPNEFVIVNEQGQLEVIPSTNTTNIGAGTVFANYGGKTNLETMKSEKGTAFLFAGFTGTNSSVVNLYDHPDIALTELLSQKKVTLVLPFSTIPPDGKTWGLVLPFTQAPDVSPKSHRIGRHLSDAQDALSTVITHLRKGLDPRIVEGSIRLGLYLIKQERQLPAQQRRWSDPQMDAGERIYREALAAGFFSTERLSEAMGSEEARQRLVDLVDNYEAIQKVLGESLGLSRTEVVGLIAQEAEREGRPFAEVAAGALDVPDERLPEEAEFDAMVRKAKAVFYTGGNSARLLWESARAADVVGISVAPVDDSGGNYAKWIRRFLPALLDSVYRRVLAALIGDYANQRAMAAPGLTRQVMADRIPKKAEWGPGDGVRDLMLAETRTAFDAFKKQYPEANLAAPEANPQLTRSMIWSLATVISAGRRLARAIGENALLSADVLPNGSGQNLLGVAVSERVGYLDLANRRVNLGKTKQAALLWNRALGLGPRDGLVIPGSHDLTNVYFLYEDNLLEDGRGAERILDNLGKVRLVRMNNDPESEIPPKDFFTVTRNDRAELVLTDALGRPLTYDAGERAYLHRDAAGEVANRFEEFPGEVERAVRERLDQVTSLSLVRGEDYASEVNSIYTGTRILAWVAEYPAGKQADVSGVAQEISQAIVRGESEAELLVFGPGSEGSSVAPHFWRRQTVEFLEELAQLRQAGRTLPDGQPVPRALFVFNPSQTNDSYDLGILREIQRYELIFRQMLGRQVRFEELFPEVLVFDHSHPWNLTLNRELARQKAMADRQKAGQPLDDPSTPAELEKADYQKILGPWLPEQKHGLIPRNRAPKVADGATLQELRSRFVKVHFAPYARVYLVVESSRGRVSRDLQVLGSPIRTAMALFPTQRDLLLPRAVREEQTVYRQQHDGEDPAAADLADFLNLFGYQTDAAEVQAQMLLPGATAAGLEEVGGPAIGVVPGAGLEAGRPPVVAEVLPITGSVERRPTPVALPAAAAIPADVRSVLGELAKARVQSNLYGMIFAEPVGLAVGVAVPGQDEAGRPLPRRFVVSNESQEQTLNDLGVDPAEMVRAWDPAYGGSIDRAIEAARSDLESRGAIVLDETVIRGLTPTFAGEFLSRIQSLSALLTPRDYSPESAARIAEFIYREMV